MRKEATLEEWNKLYDLAEKYAEMKPWELLGNDEIVCVSFSEKDRAYFTIMGLGRMEYGFGMYVGDTAFREMQLQISDPDGQEYGLYMQNCIVMFIDHKEDVPPEQMKVIRKLGRKYGKGRKWIYFENHARGYLPYIPDQQDVLNTTRFLEKLLEALTQIGRLKPHGFSLVGHGFTYKLEQSEWKTTITAWNQKELRKLPFAVFDEGLKAEAAGWRRLKTTWEVDISLLHSMVNDEKYDRPLYPYMLLVMDHKKAELIHQQLLEPADAPPVLCSYLAGLMKERGIPKKVLVHGDTMKEVLSALQSAIGVPVEIGSLNQTEQFMEGFQSNLMNMDPGEGGSILKSIGLSDEEIADLLKLSGVDTEMELIQMLGTQAGAAFAKRRSGSLFGNPEEDDIDDILGGNGGYDGIDFWGSDDEDDYELIWQEPKNMRERIRLIETFYESVCEYSEEESWDEDESDEDLAAGVINAEWCGDWKRILEQCSVEKLKEMAKVLGISSGKNKPQLASEVSGMLLEKPARVKELLSEEERALMKRLRVMVNKKNMETADMFPFSKETLVSLVKKGMADIRYGHDFMEVYLTFLIPEQMKGLRL